MNADMNPYLSPIDVVPACDSIDRFISNSVSIAGMLLAFVASVGAMVRCTVEFNSMVIWQGNSLSTGSCGVLAIAALAIASWLLLALLSSIARFVPREYITFSKSMLLIACVAMIVRLISEPSAAWTPAWPSYLLTFAGTTALAMVSFRIRMQLTGTPIIKVPVRQATA